jgi:hypothetical protein
VTTAEEMENKGLPGCVVVSGATYDHLDFQFDCERLTDLRIARHKPKPTFAAAHAAATGAGPKSEARTPPAGSATIAGGSPKHASHPSIGSIGSPILTTNTSSTATASTPGRSPVTPASRQAALRGRFGQVKNDDGFETMARYRVRGRHGNNAPQPFRTPVRIRSAAPTPPAVAAASAAIAATVPATTSSTSGAVTSATASSSSSGSNALPVATVTANGTTATVTTTSVGSTATTTTISLGNGTVSPNRSSSGLLSGHGLMVSAASSHNLPTGHSQTNGNPSLGAPPHTPVSIGGVHLTAAAQYNPNPSLTPANLVLVPSSSLSLSPLLNPNLTVTTSSYTNGHISPSHGITPLTIATSVGPSPPATLGQPTPTNAAAPNNNSNGGTPVVHLPSAVTPPTPVTLVAHPLSNPPPIASAPGVILTSVTDTNGRSDGQMSPNPSHSVVSWKTASLDSPLIGSHGGLGSARGRPTALPSLSTTLMAHASTSSIHNGGVLQHSGSHNSFTGMNGNAVASVTMNGSNGSTTNGNDHHHHQQQPPAPTHLPGQTSN